MTGRADPRRSLGTFQSVARDLFGAGDATAVARLVRETTVDLLGNPSVYVHLFDGATTRLVPAATPPDVSRERDGLAVEPADGALAWTAYLSGTPAVRQALDDDEHVFGPDDGLSRATLLPVGEYGVLTVAGEAPTRRTDETTQVSLLVTLAEAALDRLRCQHRLSAGEHVRREQATRIDRLEGWLRTLIDVERVVARARTRTGLERTVCDRLADVDDVECVWIGEPDPVTDTLTPRAWTTDRRECFDDASLDLDAGEDDDVAPAVRAARTRETVRVSDVSEGLHAAAWRRELLARGARSTASVPIAYGDDVYGVLTVSSERPDAFDDRAIELLESVATSLGHAIHAHELRRALYTDSVTELEIESDRSDDFFSRLARETGCRVEFESVAPVDAEETRRVLFTTTGAPAEAVAAVFADAPRIEGYDHLATRQGAEVFLIRLRGPFLVAELADCGAAVQHLAAEGSTTAIGVELPGTTDVRRFVERIQRICPGASIRSRTDHERPIRTRRSFRERFEERLTDRQLEALRVAARSGFFEWPRAVTGEGLAEMLDISQPTFSRHLREAERKFVDLVFDGS
ncbi:MAG: bacterio-opsin activator domain-containing protein [Haloarculaceae archaeon]